MAKDFDKIEKEPVVTKGNDGNKYFEHRDQSIQDTVDDFELASDSSLTEFDTQRRGQEKGNSRNQTDISRHNHDGINSVAINLRSLVGFAETVDISPTFTPKKFFDQFKVYKNGATKRLYVYDSLNNEWDYAPLT